MGGWGSGAWGSSPWGVGSDPFRVVRAEPVRENLVRIYFSLTPYLSRDLDPGDASDPDLYLMATDVETVGSDGLAPRAVLPVRVDVATDADAAGTALDLWLDRPLSPYPAGYSVSVRQVVATDGTPLDVSASSAPFLGLTVARPPNVATAATSSGDFAQPDTLAALLGEPGPTDSLLGTLPTDATGDYASDSGAANFRKRIFRRLTTRRGTFLHLPDYGVTTLDLVKRVAEPSVRSTIAADAEAQVRLEPDVEAARASLSYDAGLGLWVISLRVRSRTFGDQTVSAAFDPTRG